EVRAASGVKEVDPTGVGDGFRAGFFAARSWGLPLERACQVGCLVAALVLESAGAQEYEIRPEIVLKRLADSYGDGCAADVAPYLPVRVRSWVSGGGRRRRGRRRPGRGWRRRTPARAGGTRRGCRPQRPGRRPARAPRCRPGPGAGAGPA